MYFDMTYLILVLPFVLLSMWASANVKSTYARYGRIFNRRGLTGFEAARRVLDANGLGNVRINCIAGNLTDHYDPATNVVNLSQDVYSSASIAAVGVACHEVGHAIQHATDYTPIRIRSAIVPITNFGSKLSVPLIIVGFLLCGLSNTFIYVSYIGIALFGLSAVFQFITLPTEFNASSRALKSMGEMNLLAEDELKGAKKVLTAAALTYVAALAVTLMQLLRFIILANNRSRRN